MSPCLAPVCSLQDLLYSESDAEGSSPAVSLKPDLFEGLRFEFSKPLNQNFAFTHRCL